MLNYDERVLLASLTQNPKLITDNNDLNQLDLSKLAFFLYKEIDKVKPTDKNATLDLYLRLIQLKQITTVEYLYIMDNYELLDAEIGDRQFYKSYKAIKEKRFKERLLIDIETIDWSLDTPEEIAEKLKQSISTKEIVIDYPVESAHDILKTKRQANFANIKFGISKLDEAIIVEKDDLIILGARPFSGKTTLACKFAMENTKDKKVLFVSMEMSKYRIADKVRNYGGYYHKENLLIIEKSCMSISEIFTVAKAQKVSLIIIDQFNKIKSQGLKEYDKFTSTARQLKMACTEHKIPVICLAQANRETEKANRPFAFNLKGSGSLEEEPDTVIMMNVVSRLTGETVLHVDKNRSTGRLLDAEIKYNLESGTINEA